MTPFKKIGFMAKKGNLEAVEFTKRLFPIFQRQNCEVFLPEPIFSGTGLEKEGTLVSLETLVLSVDLIISLGGDGTFLKSVRLLKGRKIPLVGIKLGRVGFLTEIPKENVEKELEEMLKGNFSLEERIKLKAKISRQNKTIATFHALNDIVIHTSGVARISDYKVSLNGQFFLDIKADGVLVASPTGSTAYSFAAGGSVVEPKTKVLILTPICPQNIIFRPVIVSDETKIEVEIVYKNSHILMTADGQEQFDLEEGDTVFIGKSEECAYFLKSSGSNYLKTLRSRLFFNQT